MLQALADRLAEAFAECLHQQVRKEYWGYAKGEELSNEELIKEQYAGIRPAPGYPCPDHSEKYKLFSLLNATEKTQAYNLPNHWLCTRQPAFAAGISVMHKSQYFGVGKIGEDQLDDYAKRKAGTKKKQAAG